MKLSFKVTAAAFSLFALAACETAIQTTSGADYLARYDSTHSAAQCGPSANVDDDVREIASIEPTLAFPARIGLARIKHGALVTVPADEGYIWQETVKNLGPLYGEFVPVSPLITSIVSKPNNPDMSRDAALIADIRRGAARQHLDYVLVYEVGSSRREKANALALADLTVIGMFVLPSRSIDIEASASAILLDVRTGYPYATITSHAEKSGLSRAVSEYSTGRKLADTAEERAVAKLAADVEQGMEQLATRSLEMVSN
jgi:hypothetical protein